MGKQRLPLSLTMATVDTEGTVVDMVDTVLDTGESTASVRLPLSPRLPLSLTTDTEGTVVDTEDMVDTVLDTGESTESVRLRLSPTMAMVATVATEATEATEVTVMATASNMFLGSYDDFFFAQP